MNTQKQSALKSIPPVVWIVGGVIILASGSAAIHSLNKAAERKRANKAYQNSQVTGASPGGSGQPVTVNIAQIADGIYDAFYNNDWFGWTEDEDRAIALLLSIPKEYVKDLANMYTSMHKESLYTDFTKYLSSSDYEKVSAWLT